MTIIAGSHPHQLKTHTIIDYDEMDDRSVSRDDVGWVQRQPVDDSRQQNNSRCVVANRWTAIHRGCGGARCVGAE